MSEETSPLSNIDTLLSSNYYFFILTVGFFIFKIINIPNNLFETKKLHKTEIYTAMYIGATISMMYFINSEKVKEHCQRKNTNELWREVFISTLLPWLSIFCMIYVLLLTFPGWKQPFSNTFGYFIVMFLMGGKSKLISILENDNNADSISFKKILRNEEHLLINDFGAENVDKFPELVESHKSRFKESTNPENSKIYNDLSRLIIIKDYISEFLWFYLTGLFVVTLTNTYINQIVCL